MGFDQGAYIQAHSSTRRLLITPSARGGAEARITAASTPAAWRCWPQWGGAHGLRYRSTALTHNGMRWRARSRFWIVRLAVGHPSPPRPRSTPFGFGRSLRSPSPDAPRTVCPPKMSYSSETPGANTARGSQHLCLSVNQPSYDPRRSRAAGSGDRTSG